VATEYRVMYQRPEMKKPKIWYDKRENLIDALFWRKEAAREGDWGEVWIETREVTDWEKVKEGTDNE
jgi:hypothetical protein